MGIAICMCQSEYDDIHDPLASKRRHDRLIKGRNLYKSFTSKSFLNYSRKPPSSWLWVENSPFAGPYVNVGVSNDAIQWQHLFNNYKLEFQFDGFWRFHGGTGKDSCIMEPENKLLEMGSREFPESGYKWNFKYLWRMEKERFESICVDTRYYASLHKMISDLEESIEISQQTLIEWKVLNIEVDQLPPFAYLGLSTDDRDQCDAVLARQPFDILKIISKLKTLAILSDADVAKLVEHRHGKELRLTPPSCFSRLASEKQAEVERMYQKYEYLSDPYVITKLRLLKRQEECIEYVDHKRRMFGNVTPFEGVWYTSHTEVGEIRGRFLYDSTGCEAIACFIFESTISFDDHNGKVYTGTLIQEGGSLAIQWSDGDVWTKERLGEQDFLDELSATQIQEEVGGTVMIELTNIENEPTNLIMKDEWVLQPIGRMEINEEVTFQDMLKRVSDLHDFHQALNTRVDSEKARRKLYVKYIEEQDCVEERKKSEEILARKLLQRLQETGSYISPDLLYRWFVQNNVADSLAASMIQDEEQLDALVDDIVQHSNLKSFMKQSTFGDI